VLRVVVGLGNPGPDYENTRHNVGFWFVDYLAHKYQLADFIRTGPCLTTEGRVEGLNLLLVKPILYMNHSGRALSGLRRLRPFILENMLVCYDDVALPAGTIRIRPQGSAGGHKGLASVIDSLGTEACLRLRFGVGRENLPEELTEFVLSPFEAEEEKAVLDRFDDAADAVITLYTQGVEKAMNLYNS